MGLLYQDEISLHGGVYEHSRLESESGKMFLIVREKKLEKKRLENNEKWYNLEVTDFFFCLESSTDMSIALCELIRAPRVSVSLRHHKRNAA